MIEGHEWHGMVACVREGHGWHGMVGERGRRLGS